MGMFDYVDCKYPLPLDGANEIRFQSKDTPAQYLDRYEIRADGTLWHLEKTQWTQIDLNGELEIHKYDDDKKAYYRFQFWFRDGVVRDLIATIPGHVQTQNSNTEVQDGK